MFTLGSRPLQTRTDRQTDRQTNGNVISRAEVCQCHCFSVRSPNTDAVQTTEQCRVEASHADNIYTVY